MAQIPADHNTKYYNIEGCKVSVSFSDKPNPFLFDYVREILVTDSHICRKRRVGDTIKKTKKEG